MSETTSAPAVQGTVQDPKANTLAIVGFILAFVAPPIGIAVSKAGKAGLDSKLSKWGLGLSIVFTVLYLVLFGLSIYAAATLQGAAG
jgi:phosphotransferase system  glucose/maltose/N-acetylglucosamine-specific IIC component